MEHIDSAGVHSGDAMMCIPPWRLNNKIIETINDYTKKIALTFNVKGPFNLQFLINNDHVYVIELNIRASRSMPFVSKLVKTNLITLASKAILDKPLPHVPENKWQKIHNYGIKVPQFSFMQLDGADIALGVEMQSTGEAACFGNSFYDALSKGLTSVGYNLPDKGTALVTAGGSQNRKNYCLQLLNLNNWDSRYWQQNILLNSLKKKLEILKLYTKFQSQNVNQTFLIYFMKKKLISS